MSSNNFAKNLSYLRTQKKLSQTELAEKMGLSRQSLSNYETGKREPELSYIIKFADFFDCSIDYMIFNDIANDFSNLREINAIDDTNEIESKLDNLSVKKAKIKHIKEKIINDLAEAIKILDCDD